MALGALCNMQLDAAQKSKAEAAKQTDLQQNFLALKINDELTEHMWKIIHSFEFELIQGKLSRADYDDDSIKVEEIVTKLVDDALSVQLQVLFEKCMLCRPDINAVDKNCNGNGRPITYANHNEFYKVRNLLEKYGTNCR